MTSVSKRSADSILEDNFQDAVPPEHLNSIAISGMPDHQLHLKIGCPVILLRNLQGTLNRKMFSFQTYSHFRWSEKQPQKWDKNEGYQDDGQSSGV